MRQNFTKMGLLLFALLMASNMALAQFTVTGNVVDAESEPLIGVTVSVKGKTIGTITDFDGNYSLDVPGSAATLVYSYTGFATIENEVTSSTSTQNVVLSVSATLLDEVVITGFASSVKRSNSANAVAQIDAADLTGTTVQSTIDGALYGKFKGATISSNSGAPGGGMSIKLRGITTLNASSQPLYIVDGVFYDNSAIAGGLNTVSKAAGQGSNSNQDNPSNRIADLDPQDIETIEILKGASAAAIYGSKAASGVVIITTKRGKSGKPKVSLSQSIGFQTILNPLGQRTWDAAKVEAAFGAGEVANFQSGTLTNYEDELYGNRGIISNSRISVSGGNKDTKYFAGVTRKDEEGIVKNTGYEKTSFRLNLDQRIGKLFDLSVSTNYVTSSADRGFFNNDNSGTTMGVSFVATPPWADLLPDANGNYPNNPNGTSNFLQTRDLVTNNETINRLITGATLTTKLMEADNQSLKLILRGGIDNYTLETTAIFPRELQFQKDGLGTDGASIYGTTTNTNSNINAFLVHSYYTDSNLNFRTQLGLTQENVDQNSVLSTGTFLVGTQSNLDQAGSTQITQARLEQVDKGFFIQEEVNFDDQFILTAGLRGDKSSRNGDPNQLYFYPKASAAVNLNEFDFWGTDGPLSQLKVRAAFGQSGNFAPFGAIYNPLLPVNVSSTTGSLITTVRGNPDLIPERQSEIEVGFDLGAFDNKLLFDATYYVKNVDDLILPVRVPTSSGFSSYWVNGAAISNNGIELGLEANSTFGELSWRSRTSFWLNNAEVTRLEVPAYNVGAFGATLGTYRIEEGKSPTQLVGIGPAEQDTDNDGLIIWGDAEPDFNISFTNGLSYRNFDLSVLIHWKSGGSNVNLTTLLSDLSGTSPDFDETTLDPSGTLSNGDYRLSQLGSSAEVFIEDASYMRVREIGLYYRIPKSALGDVASIRFGLSGRNLINVFNYNSYDPEVSNFGTSAISSNVEVTPFPSAKSVFFTVGATF